MIRVMLIDDEEDALNLLALLIGQIGDVEVSGRYLDPARALEALAQAPVDAVFLDNEMPGMKGTEAARKIRETREDLPIVFTTAFAEYAVEAFEIQSTDYLLKPFTVGRLQSAVSRIKQAAAARRSSPDEAPGPAVRCLGGFRIELPGPGRKPLSWKTNKEKELCAFLLHHRGRPADASLLIESLWPEHDLKRAKSYLYACLSYLRRHLHESGVPVGVSKDGAGFSIELRDGAATDVAEFEALLNRALTDAEPDERLYVKLSALYNGEYMEGCDYRWAEARREELSGLYVRALRRLHRQFRERGNEALAAEALRRLLTIAPDSESDGRALIRLLLESDNRNEALRVYRQLEHAVRAQLGVEPEEETKRLYREMAGRA